MRTLRRRLLACLTILSLLLCLATVGLWVRSGWRWDFLQRCSGGKGPFQRFGVLSNCGDLTPFASLDSVDLNSGRRWYYSAGPSPDCTIEHWSVWLPNAQYGRFLRFGYIFLSTERQPAYRAIRFPHWFLALLFAILPAIRLRSILRNRRRNRAGLCAACGYDLRATPDRCPECGNIPG